VIPSFAFIVVNPHCETMNTDQMRIVDEDELLVLKDILLNDD
jgi:hypothetical protein